LADTTNLVHLVSSIQPTEIYNLAAQSHVKVSFDMAEYTGDVSANSPPLPTWLGPAADQPFLSSRLTDSELSVFSTLSAPAA